MVAISVGVMSGGVVSGVTMMGSVMTVMSMSMNDTDRYCDLFQGGDWNLVGGSHWLLDNFGSWFADDLGDMLNVFVFVGR